MAPVAPVEIVGDIPVHRNPAEPELVKLGLDLAKNLRCIATDIADSSRRVPLVTPDRQDPRHRHPPRPAAPDEHQWPNRLYHRVKV